MVAGRNTHFVAEESQNKALDAEPPIASFLKSMLIGVGPVNAPVRAADQRLSAMLRLVCLKVRPSDVIGLLFPIIRS